MKKKTWINTNGQSKSIGIKVFFFSCKSMYKTDYFLYDKKKTEKERERERDRPTIERKGWPNK